MPVVDNLAAEYGDRIAFVAVAWKGTEEATARRADEWFQSGKVAWGLDADEHIFGAYGIPYQPATVLIGRDGRIIDSWLGARPEEEMRASIRSLLGA